MSHPDSTDPEETIQDLSWRHDKVDGNSTLTYNPKSYITPAIFKSRPHSPGNFSIIPYEIQQQILNLLDFQSLAAMRASNYHFRTLVDTLRVLRIVVEHVPEVLVALKETETMRYHPVSQIYNALKSEECAFCYDYGPFLFLLTCQRACFNCVLRNTELRLFASHWKDKHPGLEDEHLKKLKTMKCVPGVYACDKTSFGQRTILFLWSEVQPIAEECARVWEEEQKRERQERREDPDRHSPVFRPVTSCIDPASLDTRSDDEKERDFVNYLDEYRCVGATPFPSLNADGRTEEGLWCKGCNIGFWWEMNYSPIVDGWRSMEQNMYRAFSRRGFLEHLKECEGAAAMLRMLAARREGTWSTF